MAEAWKVLSPTDAVEVYEQLLPAQNKSYVLGLRLELPPHVVEAIHSKDLPPERYLLHVLIKFLERAEPPPTWRVIVEALKSKAVDLGALANRVEAAHPIPTCDVVSETTGTLASVANITAGDDEIRSKRTSKPSSQLSPATVVDRESAANITAGDDVRSEPSSQLSPATVEDIERVEAEIEEFHQRFNSIKDLTIRGLEKCHVAVITVVYILTSILAREHAVFLKENHKALRQCEDYLELFGFLNFYWNFLAYNLLDHLIRELVKKHMFFEAVSVEMVLYKKEIQEFRKRTPLNLFCQTGTFSLDEDPPPGFRKIVVKFDLPQTATLEDLERFRRRYASNYDLQKCAMMLSSVRTGSFTVTWFIPVSVVEMLRKKRTLGLFKEFSVTRLEIHTSSQICVYQPQSQLSEADEDYPFVEEPSDDFFCPVTKGLMLQPHLTSCCGQHLSQEAATRIQGERGACPLCKKQSWNTVLNKYIQRQVNSQRVFCRHEDKGCGWEGVVSDFYHHMEFCPRRDCPPMTKLAKSPVYGNTVSGASPHQLTTSETSGITTKVPLQNKIDGGGEPTERSNHILAPVNGKSFLIGGETYRFAEEAERNRVARVLSVFKHETIEWEHYCISNDDIPPGVRSGGFCAQGKFIYSFGGRSDTGSGRYNTLHKFDTENMQWMELPSKISSRPIPKAGCDPIIINDKLYLFGGYGTMTGPTQPGSIFHFDEGGTDNGHINEFHIYDLSNVAAACWVPGRVSGDRPPPCSYYTMTLVDSKRAVMFGGNTKTGRMNDVYIMTLDGKHVNFQRMRKYGPWPQRRSSHAACVLNFDQEFPQVVVAGGLDENTQALGDLWLLSVDHLMWMKIRAHEVFLHRWRLTMSCVSSGKGNASVLVFGGVDSDGYRMSYTTVLNFRLKENTGNVSEWTMEDDTVLGDHWGSAAIPVQAVEEETDNN